MPNTDAQHRRQTSRPNTDAKHRCQTSMPSIDAQHRCQTSTPNIDAKHRRQTSIPNIDAQHRRPTSIPNIHAKHRCQTPIPTIPRALVPTSPRRTGESQRALHGPSPRTTGSTTTQLSSNVAHRHRRQACLGLHLGCRLITSSSKSNQPCLGANSNSIAGSSQRRNVGEASSSGSRCASESLAPFRVFRVRYNHLHSCLPRLVWV